MKKAALLGALVIGAALVSATPSHAQFQRHDYVWARSTNGAALTLDGHLSEAQWAQAESIVVLGRTIGAAPGSGWKDEGGFPTADPIRAVVRFLTVGNNLWVGVTVRDSSIGGSSAFNTMDGLLMSIKQHQLATRPAPPGEHFTSWWWPVESNYNPGDPVLNKMSQMGIFRNWPARDTTYTPTQLQAWDVAYSVNGTVNDDATADQGYTVEMRFGLSATGYDVTQVGGDVVEWNMSIYDTDWVWPLSNYFRYASNRTWIQGPWGNAGWYHNLKVLGRPDVTVSSGSTPAMAADMVIPNGIKFAYPTIDGNLNESVWANAPSFKIEYGNPAVRAGYPGSGPYRSGEFQPSVNNGTAFVQDPLDATVKYFYKGTKLYIGIDATDAVVQYHPTFDRWDGGILSINDHSKAGNDKSLLSYRMSFQVGPTGQLVASDSLPNMIANGQVKAALALKPGTTVDTLGVDIDSGWQAEFEVDLLSLGYNASLGDRAFYWALDLCDGDSYIPFTDSYGTRSWFFRQYENEDGPCVAALDANTLVPNGTLDVAPPTPVALELLGNFPNPFRGTTSVSFRLPQASNVSLDVFDLQGRLVHSHAYGVQAAGEARVHVAPFAGHAGVYLYRVSVSDPNTGASKGTLSGKMLVME